MLSFSTKNPEIAKLSPDKSRVFKNYQQSTTCFQMSKGKSIQFKDDYKIYNIKSCQKQKQNENLTFQPRINEFPHELYPHHNTNKLNRSHQQIRQKLIQDTTQKIRGRLKAKIQRQLQQTKHYSFHPKISDFSQKLASQKKGELLIHQKLYKQAEQIEQSKLKAQKQKQSQQTQQIQRLLNFKLLLPERRKVLNSEKYNLGPIQNRIEQIIKKSLNHRKQLQNQIQKQKKMTFQPSINPCSLKIADNKIERQNLKTNVIQRLMQQYEKMKKNRQNELEAVKKKQQDECTFHPEINRNYVMNREFLSSRSQYYDKYKELHCNCEQDQNKYSFCPQINPISQLITAHARQSEDMNRKLQRLSQDPIRQKQEKLEKLRQKIYKQFTFEPKINDISSQIQAEHRNHKCEAPPIQIFSFKPKINEKSKLIRSQSAQSKRMKAKKKQLMYKLQAQYEQMKQCSFEPKINNKRHADQRTLHEVEGVDSYMSHQQLARQKQQDLQNRKKQLFHLEVKYDQRVSKKQIN